MLRMLDARLLFAIRRVVDGTDLQGKVAQSCRCKGKAEISFKCNAMQIRWASDCGVLTSAAVAVF
jgi:hypothetical protein